jgi:hypothetical protein
MTLSYGVLLDRPHAGIWMARWGDVHGWLCPGFCDGDRPGGWTEWMDSFGREGFVAAIRLSVVFLLFFY